MRGTLRTSRGDQEDGKTGYREKAGKLNTEQKAKEMKVAEKIINVEGKRQRQEVKRRRRKRKCQNKISLKTEQLLNKNIQSHSHST